MRKLKILLLSLGIFMTTFAFGQEESDIFTRHEVNIGYGMFPSTTPYFNVYNTNFYPTPEYFGSVFASYTYKFNKVIGIGATIAYDNNYYNLYDVNVTDKTDVCNVKQNVFSVIAHVKVNWVRTRFVTMYSKAGLGGSFYANNVTKLQPDDLYEVNTDNLKKATFNFSAVGVGIEIGTKQYAGFLQVGYGVEGIISLGFRYGINKTYKQ